MAIRKDIVWTVADDGSVTPTTPQDGGVQGEHHATRAVWQVGEVWKNPKFTLYVECEDSAGNVDTTEPLQVEGGQVSVLLPLAWTQYGGMSTLRLVAEEQDGTVAMTAEGLVRFDSRQNASKKVDGLLKGRLATMEKRISGLAAGAEQAVADAAAAKEAAYSAAASASVSRDGAQLAAKEAKKAVSGKLDKFDTDEYSYCLCDEEGNVIAAHDKTGKPLTKDPDRDQQMQEILDTLATLSAGRLTTFYTADYAWCFCDEDGNVCCGALPTGEKVGFGGGDGWEQALQEVWDAIDNLPSGGATGHFNYKQCGLPVLYLTGDTTDMSKETEVELAYTFKTAKGKTITSGTCSCKWQGSSSVSRNYPKRNYTLKFEKPGFDATALWPFDSERVTNFPNKDGVEVWGKQTKYCAKANWIDPSGVRNVASARLWASIVKDRAERYNNVPDKLLSAPNYGAIDGFPCIIALNGEFLGLYTFNIPKDDWMFNMGDGVAEYVVAAENNGLSACGFSESATFIEDENGKLDYAIEVKPDNVTDETVIDSFNDAIGEVLKAPQSAEWESMVAPYFDVDAAIDYLIFVCCIGARDNLRKNALYATYDGEKWFMSAYDLDTTFGANVHAKGWYPVINDRNQFKEACSMHRVFDLIYNYSTAKLVNRYGELRSTVLSDENVWYVLQNFANDIPKAVYNMDAEKWTAVSLTRPLLGSTTANVENYMHYYRMHCACLDKEIEALREKEE